jgi:hypothetical protein
MARDINKVKLVVESGLYLGTKNGYSVISLVSTIGSERVKVI